MKSFEKVVNPILQFQLKLHLIICLVLLLISIFLVPATPLVIKCWKERSIVEEVDKDRRGSRRRKMKEAVAEKQLNSSRSRSSVDRPVDRPQYQELGRPARSTEVHQCAQVGARSTARSTD